MQVCAPNDVVSDCLEALKQVLVFLNRQHGHGHWNVSDVEEQHHHFHRHWRDYTFTPSPLIRWLSYLCERSTSENSGTA